MPCSAKMTDFDEAAIDDPELSATLSTLLAKDAFDEALRVAEQAKQKYAGKDPKAEASAWRAISRANCAKVDRPPSEGAVEAALEAAQAAIAASKIAKDDAGEAAGLNLMARAHILGRKDQEALRAAEEALAKFQAQANLSGEASASCTLARVYILAGRNQKAFESANKAYVTFRGLGERRGEAMALHALFDTYMAMTKYRDALHASETMADLFQALDIPFGQGLAKLLSAEVHQTNEDRQEAISMCQEASHLFKKVGASRKMAVANKLGAEAAIVEGMPNEALEMVERALMCFKQAGDKLGQAGAMITMSNLYSAVGEFDKATYRAEAAAEAYKKLKATVDAAAAMRTACLAFLDKKLFNPKASASVAMEAMKTANASLKLYEEAGDVQGSGYGLSLNALAQAHVAAGNAGRGLELAEEAQALFRRIGDQVGVAATLNTLAQVFQSRGDTFEAVNAAREAQQLFQEHDDDRGAQYSAFLMELFQAPPEQEEAIVPVEAEDQQAKKSGPSRSGLADLIPGGAQAVTPIVSWEAYEGRAAAAPGQRKAAPGTEAGVTAIVKEQALFSVRWVPMKNVPTSPDPSAGRSAASRVIKKGLVSDGGAAPVGLVPSSRRYLESALPVY